MLAVTSNNFTTLDKDILVPNDPSWDETQPLVLLCDNHNPKAPKLQPSHIFHVHITTHLCHSPK